MSTAATTASVPELLVIGGTGFLGRRLLGHDGRSVAATHRRPERRERGSDTVTWHPLTLDDGGADAAALIAALAPAAVINAAAVMNGPTLDAVTARAPGAMAAATAAIGARFVHLSSDVVFDGTTPRPYVETDPVGPVHAYGRAKAEAERLVAAADPAAVIVRTSLLWGPPDDGGRQFELARDPEVRFYTDEIRSPLAVDRLAAACLELCDRPDLRGPLHVAGADHLSRFEFARRLAALDGRDPEQIRGTAGPIDTPRPRHCPLDSSRARAVLRTALTGVLSAP